MLFQIDPLPGENRRACQALAAQSLPPSRANALVIGVYAAVVIAAYVLTPDTVAWTVAIGIGAVLITNIGLRADSRARMNRMETDDPHATERHFIELSAEGMRAWCSHVDTRYVWTGTRITETPDFVLLMRGPAGGLAIPKRLLDPARREELRGRLQQWAPDCPVELTQ